MNPSGLFTSKGVFFRGGKQSKRIQGTDRGVAEPETLKDSKDPHVGATNRERKAGSLKKPQKV
jgi:hypothetical protein